MSAGEVTLLECPVLEPPVGHKSVVDMSLTAIEGHCGWVAEVVKAISGGGNRTHNDRLGSLGSGCGCVCRLAALDRCLIETAPGAEVEAFVEYEVGVFVHNFKPVDCRVGGEVSPDLNLGSCVHIGIECVSACVGCAHLTDSLGYLELVGHVGGEVHERNRGEYAVDGTDTACT